MGFNSGFKGLNPRQVFTSQIIKNCKLCIWEIQELKLEYNFLSLYSMINTIDCKIFNPNQQIPVMFNHNMKQYVPKKQLVLDTGKKLSDSFVVFMCHWIQLELK